MNIRLSSKSFLLCAVLGLSVVVNLVPSSQATNAYTTRQELRVERLKSEPYDVFIRRSELILRTALQQSFDRDTAMNSIVILVIGQNQRLEAPVMRVEVSRSQWQNRPDARVWATYYRMSQILLGFGSASTPDLFQEGMAPVQPLTPVSPQPAKPLPLSTPSVKTKKTVPRTTPSPTPTQPALPSPPPIPAGTLPPNANPVP